MLNCFYTNFTSSMNSPVFYTDNSVYFDTNIFDNIILYKNLFIFSKKSNVITSEVFSDLEKHSIPKNVEGYSKTHGAGGGLVTR